MFDCLVRLPVLHNRHSRNPAAVSSRKPWRQCRGMVAFEFCSANLKTNIPFGCCAEEKRLKRQLAVLLEDWKHNSNDLSVRIVDYSCKDGNWKQLYLVFNHLSCTLDLSLKLICTGGTTLLPNGSTLKFYRWYWLVIALYIHFCRCGEGSISDLSPHLSQRFLVSSILVGRITIVTLTINDGCVPKQHLSLPCWLLAYFIICCQGALSRTTTSGTYSFIKIQVECYFGYRPLWLGI